MISERTIEEIKERVSLSEVIGEVVQLKRQGSALVGLCPFHSEKSPSFSVREDARFYHCFGCGASGNVITFIMQSRGMSFVDAVEDLAQRAGITIERTGLARPQQRAKDSRPLLLQINAKAQSYFRNALREAGAEVQSYVTKRGLSSSAIESFEIGFAPLERQGLYRVLKAAGYTDEQMLLAGAVRRSQRGEILDTFRGRLIFPIGIDKRRIAAFGGRLIDSLFEGHDTSRMPKYINSPETPLYHKSKVFFGIPQALDAIRSAKHLYMVEGYMDVVGLHQCGVRNVLATCGTSLTSRHVKRLATLAKRITVLFDGDAAGMNAAGRCFELFLNAGVDTDAIFLPDEQDPDSFAAAHGPDTVRALERLPKLSLFDCYMRRIMQQEGDLSGAAAKGRVAAQLRTVLGAVTNSIEQHAYIERAALRLGVPPGELEALVRQGRAMRMALHEREPEEKQPTQVEVHPQTVELPPVDQELLRVVMGLREEIVPDAMRDPMLFSELHPSSQAFLQALSEVLRPGNDDARLQLRELLKAFGPTWRALWKQAHEMRADPTVDLRRAYQECRLSIQRLMTERLIAEQQGRLKRELDPEARLEIAQNLRSLELRRRGHHVGTENKP